MARKKMVSRSIVGTDCEVLVFSFTSNEIDTIKVLVSGEFTDVSDKKLVKMVEKETDSNLVKVISIKSATPVTRLYGMYESDFYANAMELDPVTRKPINDPNADVEVDADEGTEEQPTEEQEQTVEEKPNKKSKK